MQLLSLTAMKEFSNFSLEEIRLADYKLLFPQKFAKENSPPSAEKPSTMSFIKDFAKLLNNKDFSDVQFKLNGNHIIHFLSSHDCREADLCP